MSKKNKLSKQDEFQVQKMKYYIDRYMQLNKARKVSTHIRKKDMRDVKKKSEEVLGEFN